MESSKRLQTRQCYWKHIQNSDQNLSDWVTKDIVFHHFPYLRCFLLTGKKILNVALIANECIHTKHKDREPGLYLQVGLGKKPLT